MTVKARTKNIGISAKKIRPLVNLLRGKKAVDAINILSFMPSNSSEVLLELIKSAIANAENAQYGTKEELVISTIYADQSTVSLVGLYISKYLLFELPSAYSEKNKD